MRNRLDKYVVHTPSVPGPIFWENFKQKFGIQLEVTLK